MLSEKGLARNEAYGYLALENLERVAERMRTMFGEGASEHRFGSKYYTVVTVNEYFGVKAEVRTSQRTRGEFRTWLEGDGNNPTYGGITWSDGNYSSGVHTSAKTEADAYDQPRRDQAYLKFTHDRLIINHYAPSGSELQWTLVLENHSED